MKISPKDFFLHLGVVVTLYTGAGSLINLIFSIIDAVFPNQTYYNYYNYSPISWAVATLIIVFPLYVLLTWLLNKDYKAFPEKKTFGFRKWLIYLTLFISGGVIAGDLIFLLYRFLGGEIITTGFILKAAVIFIIAGGIFSYYISDLRDTTSSKRNRIYIIAISVIILALIAYGFSIFGSPRTQRLLRADSQKVMDVQSIQWQIVNFWQQKGALPASLNELNDPISGFMVPMDFDTKQPYEYRRISERTFELCAVFNRDSSDANRSTMPAYTEKIGMSGTDNWQHSVGRTCFERTIDPELYPVRKI